MHKGFFDPDILVVDEVLAVGDIEKFTPLIIAKMVLTLPKINKKFWNPDNCK